MSENKVKWHPYPDEKPSREDRYLVTVEEVNSDLYIADDYYYYNYETFGLEERTTTDEIIAWAELPEPYRE